MGVIIRFSLIFIVGVSLVGCLKDDSCESKISWPCYEKTNQAIGSSFIGTYDGQEVCIHEGVDTYECKGWRTGISTTNADGSNLMAGGYYGTIEFRSSFHSYETPIIRISTPILPSEEGERLTYWEMANERIQHFNSKQTWKLGYQSDNRNDEYLGFSVRFDCIERNRELGLYSVFFNSHNELLESESYIEILSFNVEESKEEVHYDINFDIDTYLYNPNCLGTCRRNRLQAVWRAVFSIPKK